VDANDLSVVLLLEWGAFRALLTGDAPQAVENALARTGLLEDIDVLKVGHHGSRTSTGSALLRATLPEVALISAGRDNGFGHPHAEVLDRLAAHGVRVLRTDRDGTIVVRVDRDGRYRVGGRD